MQGTFYLPRREYSTKWAGFGIKQPPATPAAGLVLLVVLAGKPLSALLTVRLLGRPLSVSLPVGAALAQVGEFSFILGTAARRLDLIGNAGWNALVGAAIISIALNPSLYRLARKYRA